MDNSRNTILQKIYDEYYFGEEYSLLAEEEYPYPDIKYLISKEYIEAIKEFSNGGIYTITAKGIDFVENGYIEKQLNNSNNIIINGSNNTVSNNFNNITNNINNSDLDENSKTELINFINELQIHKEDESTILQKISSFVTNVVTTASTNVATQQLTTLIYSIFFNHWECICDINNISYNKLFLLVSLLTI